MLGKTNVKVKPNKKKPLIDYVEYIESTGTQYINTDVLPATDITYEIYVEITKATSQEDTCLFGGRKGGDSNQYVLWDGHNTSNAARRTIPVLGSLSSAYNYSSPAGKTVFEYDGSKFYCNGEAIFTMTNTNGYSNYPIYLFALNNGNKADTSRLYKGKFFYFKIYKAGVLIRDFRPVKDGAGVYCLYDEVEERYYYNQGTGQFIGSGWEPTQLEYIESTGTQYIDTGVYVNSNFEWEMDFQFTDVSTSMWSGTGETTSASMGICAGISYNYFLIGVNNGTWSSKETSFLKDTSRHTLDFKSGSQSIDGTQVANFVFNSTQGKNTFPLATFCTLWGTGPTSYSNYCKMKIYSCKIYDNNVLIRDYIPALDYNNVVCLYDKVTKTCFYNQGTGEFLGGVAT